MSQFLRHETLQAFRTRVRRHDLVEERARVHVLRAGTDREHHRVDHGVPGRRERVDLDERGCQRVGACDRRGHPIRSRLSAASGPLPLVHRVQEEAQERRRRRDGQAAHASSLRREPLQGARDARMERRHPTSVARFLVREVRQLVREERAELVNREDPAQRQRKAERPARDRPVQRRHLHLGDGHPGHQAQHNRVRRLGSHRVRHPLHLVRESPLRRRGRRGARRG